MNKPNSMIERIPQISNDDDQSIEEIPRNDLSEEDIVHFSPELLKLAQILAKYYFYQVNSKKKFLTGNTDPLTPTDFNQLVPGNQNQIIPLFTEDDVGKVLSKIL